jgi:hypothetical protein
MLHQNPSSAVWKLGTITQNFWKLHYQVKLDDVYMLQRHVNHPRKTEIPKRSVSFVPSTKLKENDDRTRQQVAVTVPWIGLLNLEANLQQPDGWNNQDVPAQPAHEDVQKAPAQPVRMFSFGG